MKAKFTLEPLPLPFFTYYYKNLEQRSHPNSQYGYMLNEKGQFKNLLIQKEKKINEIKNNSSKCGQTKNIFQPLCEVLCFNIKTIHKSLLMLRSNSTERKNSHLHKEYKFLNKSFSDNLVMEILPHSLHNILWRMYSQMVSVQWKGTINSGIHKRVPFSLWWQCKASLLVKCVLPIS